MRRLFIVAGAILLIQLCVGVGLAQDRLEGRWEGKTVSPQGERATTATFKKEASGYSGVISGMRGDMQLKDIKLDGDKVTAKAEVNAQGNAIVVNYTFNLQGENLKGVGAIDFGGQSINLDIELKRTGGAAAAAAAPAAAARPTGGASSDKLLGRWEGKIQSPQGERETNIVFRKEGDKYLGTSPGMMPGTNIELKDIKLDGDKVTAKADVDSPQGTITINYTFTLAGEAMKGQGALDFGGNAFTFDIDLKRIGAAAGAPAQAAGPGGGQAQGGPGGGGQGGGQGRQRTDVPQPQQKQSIDYFVGQWGFKYVGRESALGGAPREGTVTFVKGSDGKSAMGTVAGSADGKSYSETWNIIFDEATKQMTVTEKLAAGVQLNSKADWSSPISIRFTIPPVKIKGQSLQLRRVISIVAAHSFTVTDELSEDGGPFVRLGNAVYSKVGAK